MSEISADSAAGPAEVDPDELLKELRRQIDGVRHQMEVHRETMLAAGLTGAAAAEPASFAPEPSDRAVWRTPER